MVIIHFIRHGESEGNVQTERMGGRTLDLELTPTGTTQAKQLARFLADADINVHEAVSSHAKRARTTAAIVGEELAIPIRTDERLAEIDMGEFERALINEVMTQEVREEQKRLRHDWRPPGGETMNEVIARNQQALHELLERHDPQEERHILWFGHGGAIRALTTHLLNIDAVVGQLSLHNTGRCVLGYDGERWHLHRWNDTAHLY